MGLASALRTAASGRELTVVSREGTTPLDRLGPATAGAVVRGLMNAGWDAVGDPWPEGRGVVVYPLTSLQGADCHATLSRRASGDLGLLDVRIDTADGSHMDGVDLRAVDAALDASELTLTAQGLTCTRRDV